MDIFSKLDTLKSIEPSESWVVETREKVLSEAPIFGRKNMSENIIDKESNLGFNLQNLFQNLSFKKLMVPAFSLVFVLSTGVFTVGASKSSLPGDFLYPVKMAKENVILAISSEDKKAAIEVEHAGKRVEEIVEISKKTSDIEQQRKLAQLMERFDEKMSSANDRLANTSGNGEKTKIAKVINIQSKKYTEVLAKTTDDLPAVVKDEILEEVAKAIDSSEKINLTSLAAMVEGMTDENKDEITAMVKEKVEETALDEDDIVTEEAMVTEEIADGTDEESVDNTEDTADIEKEAETAGTIEDLREELLDDLDNCSDDGDVLGVEDNVEDNVEDSVEDSVESDSSDITVDNVGNEEIILEETEEDVVKEEIVGEGVSE